MQEQTTQRCMYRATGWFAYITELTPKSSHVPSYQHSTAHQQAPIPAQVWALESIQVPGLDELQVINTHAQHWPLA